MGVMVEMKKHLQKLPERSMLSTRKQSGPPVRFGTNEDKDVLIGCLCLFCFCGWEIRSGLGITEMERVDWK